MNRDTGSNQKSRPDQKNSKPATPEWDEFYSTRTGSYDGYIRAPHISRFMNTIIRFWNGGSILEIGTGTGYMSIWLSKTLPYITVSSLDYNTEVLKQASTVADMLDGKVDFIEGDAFYLGDALGDNQYDIIFHQGVLEHFTNEEISKQISQQVDRAAHVIFSIPSVFYRKQDFGDERLLDIDEWTIILKDAGAVILESGYLSHDTRDEGNEQLYFVLEGKNRSIHEKEIRQESTPNIQIVNPVAPEVFWRSVVFNPSGYASAARGCLTGMNDAGIRVALDPSTNTFEGDFDADSWSNLLKMIKRKRNKSGPFVHFHPPVGFQGEDFLEEAKQFYTGHPRYIGYSLFETDSIPESWIHSLNKMDEVWVTNEFNYDTYTRAGVFGDKVKIIPLGIDPDQFNPEKIEAVELPGKKSFNFVSVFEWTKRKGWDVLLEAYLKEFDYREDVNLVLFVYRGTGTNPDKRESATEKAAYFTMEKLNLDPHFTPKITVVEKILPNNYIPRLLVSADCFVLPSRGEGWGLPYMEAMALGIPVIGTGWGGNTTFMNSDNSFMIDVLELEPVDVEQYEDNQYYKGQKWAKPDIESTKRHMRHVFENRNSAKEQGRYARHDIISNWTHRNTGNAIKERLIAFNEEDEKKSRSRRIIRPEDSTVQVQICGDVTSVGGNSGALREQVLSLERLTSINLKTENRPVSNIKAEIDVLTEDTLDSLNSKPAEADSIRIWHSLPDDGFPDKNTNIVVYGFGTELPSDNDIKNLSQADEVWVYNQERKTALASAVIPDDNIHIIPRTIDADRFDRAIAPLFIAGKAGFNFLSVLDWDKRKGWDVLIKAFVEEFKNYEDVSLVLKITPGHDTEAVSAELSGYISETLGHNPEKAPTIFLINKTLSAQEMVQLYKAVDAYVLPSRCEKTGRTYLEAMAMGLPVIGTPTGSTSDILTADAAYTLSGRTVTADHPEFEGLLWTEPDAAELKKLMRHVFDSPADRRDKSANARKHIENNFDPSFLAKAIVDRLNRFSGDNSAKITDEKEERLPLSKPEITIKTSAKEETVKTVWEGSQFMAHSLALVNREVCSRLLADDRIELSLIPFGEDDKELFNNDPRYKDITGAYGKKLSSQADIHIRHQWPPNFDRPGSGQSVLMQPWEFGYLPKDWINPIMNTVDEVWVYSSAVRQCYVNSGIPVDRIFTVPLGVDPEKFNPDIGQFTLQTGKSYKFLSVGGSIWRKGIDTLLDVYISTFSHSDDVCLVIKDMGGDSFYRGMNAAEKIRDIQQDPNLPEIEYITDTLTEKEIAGLYTACDCFVHPYRGEGFGLPVAEAMACGLPVILTEGGATEDFCPDDTVYKIPSEKILVNIEMELVDQGWVLQPDPRALAGMMRKAVNRPDEFRETGKKASKHIIANYTFDRTASIIADRIIHLKEHSGKPERSEELETVVPDTPAKPVIQDMSSGELIARADEFFSDQDYENALKFYAEAWYRNNADIDLTVKCAETAVRLDKKLEAEKFLQECIIAAPENPDAYNTYGVFLANMDNLQEAAASFLKALEFDADNLDSLLNLVEIYYLIENYEQTLVYGGRALKLAPQNNILLLTIGNALAMSGNLKEAKNALEALLKLDPGNKDAMTSLNTVNDALEG